MSVHLHKKLYQKLLHPAAHMPKEHFITLCRRQPSVFFLCVVNISKVILVHQLNRLQTHQENVYQVALCKLVTKVINQGRGSIQCQSLCSRVPFSSAIGYG